MKTYTVQFPPNCSPAVEAVADSILRGFALAIPSCSTYKWRNFAIGENNTARWFDTDNEVAAFALKMELSNIGIQVNEQPAMPVDPISWEAWDRAAQRSW